MSMETPRSPREELEARVTALLLGELSAEEEGALRLAMAEDPALAQLHDRLSRTLGLVREAAGLTEATDLAPAPAPQLQISAARRAKLLEAFKVMRPAGFASQVPRHRRFFNRELAGIAAMFVALLILAGVVMQWFLADQQIASPKLALLPSRLADYSLSDGRQLRRATVPSSSENANEFFFEASREAKPTPAPEKAFAWKEVTLPPGVPLAPPPPVESVNRGMLVPGTDAKRQSVVLPQLQASETLGDDAALGNESVPAPGAEPKLRRFFGDEMESRGVPSSSTGIVPPLNVNPSTTERAGQPQPGGDKNLSDAAVVPRTADFEVATKGVFENPVPQLRAATDLAGEGTIALGITPETLTTTPAKPEVSARAGIAGASPASGQNAAPGPSATADAPAAPAVGQVAEDSQRQRFAYRLGGNVGQNTSGGLGPTSEMRTDNAPVVAAGTTPAPMKPTKMVEAKDASGPAAKDGAGNARLRYAPAPPNNQPLAVGDAGEPQRTIDGFRKPTDSVSDSEKSVAKLEFDADAAGALDAKDATRNAGSNVDIFSVNSVGFVATDSRTVNGRDLAATDQSASGKTARGSEGVERSYALPDVATKPAGQVARLGRQVDERLEGVLDDLNVRAGDVKARPESAKPEIESARPLEELSRLKRVLTSEKMDAAIRKTLTTAPDPQPEVQAAANPFSTFSLNVSDVSFKLAAAALEKGAMPDPATVRSEEFINAFDYRDPEPPPGVPVAFAWERARYPFAHNRDLLRFSLKTAARGRQAGRPLNLVLLLDNSGSMERADRVRIIRECLRVLARQLQPQDRVSVVAFARTPRLWVDGLPGAQAGELPDRVGGLTPQGGTNLEEAMNLAYQTARRHFLAEGINRVVLLTDGAANLGDVDPDSLRTKVETYRRQGVALDCFGIGWEGLNDELLETLSRHGDGRYGFVNSPEAAAREFAGQLAGALQVAASDVKVQIEFNPRRVTAYRQMGYAKHQLRKEQFRDNAVDAAEIAAAEAGNALYTAEVNPAGEGPIATVRVRFKIPGTADYREREWPVPYEGVAKMLEQSSPALRLAGAAAAFSEWLVVSPFAAEVTPDRLLSLLRGVPEGYGADPRPKKLEWMVRQAASLAGK